MWMRWWLRPSGMGEEPGLGVRDWGLAEPASQALTLRLGRAHCAPLPAERFGGVDRLPVAADAPGSPSEAKARGCTGAVRSGALIDARQLRSHPVTVDAARSLRGRSNRGEGAPARERKFDDSPACSSATGQELADFRTPQVCLQPGCLLLLRLFGGCAQSRASAFSGALTIAQTPSHNPAAPRGPRAARRRPGRVCRAPVRPAPHRARVSEPPRSG
jgi:hypothetical protein